MGAKQRSRKNDLTPDEALEVLGLGPNRRYLTYLYRRGLIEREEIGPKSFRYNKNELEKLRERAKEECIYLTTKA